MRRLFLVLACLALAAGLLLAALPLWLGGVLRWAGPRAGLTFDAYSTRGYGRFVLTGLEVRQPGVEVRVDTVEVDSPLVHLLRLLVDRPREVVAGRWSVVFVPSPPRTGPRPPVGWIPLRRQLLQVADGLSTWMPRARAGAGALQAPGLELTLAGAQWEGGTLAAKDFGWREERFDVECQFDGDVIRARANARRYPLTGRVESRDTAVTGELVFAGQKAPLEATFAPAGWLPQRATLRAESWTVAGSELALPRYRTVTGTATLTWADAQFRLETDVRGESDEGGAPPLEVSASARGGGETVTVERFTLLAPGARATLSDPVDVNLRTRVLAEAAALSVDVDLAALPWGTQEGRFSCLVRLEPRSTGWPSVHFQAEGRDLRYLDRARLGRAQLSGRLDWPKLRLETAEVFAGEDGRVSVTGSVDFLTREVADVRAEGNLPFEVLSSFVPKDLWFAHATFAVNVAGIWTAVHHEGTLLVDELERPGLRPAELRLWWRGEGTRFPEVEAGIRAADTEVVAAGAVEASGAEVRRLVWRHGGEDRLALERAARLQWADGTLRVDAFDLVGKAGELRASGSWGPRGELRFFARGISAEWWRNFVPRTPFEWSIEALSLTADWDEGPVRLKTAGRLFLDLTAEERITVDLAAAADGSTLALEHLRASESGKEFAYLTGELPFAVRVAPRLAVEFARSSALKAEGFVRPESRWWSELGARTGLHLHQPRLSLTLGGSWDAPVGDVRLQVSKVEMDARLKPEKWPPLEAIEGTLRATPQALELSSLSARVAGQPLAVSGRLDLTSEVRTQLRNEPLQALKDHLEVGVTARDVELASLAPFVSGVLAPQGRLDADLRASSRGPWSGYLRVSGAATRPLPGAGPLRDIEADLRFEGRRAEIARLELGFGGQPVRASGSIELPVDGAPIPDIVVRGKNLPFVRQAGFLLRGDVDLKLGPGQTPGVPEVRGKLALRDGLFLSDVRAFIPTGGSGPERRPPYFAVQAAPFDRWRLDVSVEGERFLRARTALFNGVASMRFHLGGTLGSPRALGLVRIDEGQVLFPFARFNLQDASVRLTEENPYDPQLGVFGTSRRYGYDLRLELTGTASSPNLQFSSSPPLNSEQVLLLVMAGQTPRNEVSYSTSQRFTRLGTFFGQSLLSSLGGAGGEERLTLSSGERISRQGRETYRVEYEVDDRWSLVGEYDEFDEYNAGLRFQVVPRSDKPEEDK